MECVILIGLQGAGKTTFYEGRFARTHVHVSKDRFRAARSKARRQEAELRKAFDASRSVVVDNTNATAAARAPIIHLARIYRAVVVAYYFDVSTREAVGRNSRRSGKGRVPDVAIFATAHRLQPPSIEEGFDRIYRVRPGEARRFAIEEWTDVRLSRSV